MERKCSDVRPLQYSLSRAYTTERGCILYSILPLVLERTKQREDILRFILYGILSLALERIQRREGVFSTVVFLYYYSIPNGEREFPCSSSAVFSL